MEAHAERCRRSMRVPPCSGFFRRCFSTACSFAAMFCPLPSPASRSGGCMCMRSSNSGWVSQNEVTACPHYKHGCRCTCIRQMSQLFQPCCGWRQGTPSCKARLGG